MCSKFNGTHHTKAEVTQFLHNARLTSVIPCVKAKILVPLHFSHRERDFWLKPRHCYAIVHNYGCCFTLLVCQGRPWIFFIIVSVLHFPVSGMCMHTYRRKQRLFGIYHLELKSLLGQLCTSWFRKTADCVRWPSANCCQCHCKAKRIKLRTTLSTNQSAPSPNYCC